MERTRTRKRRKRREERGQESQEGSVRSEEVARLGRCRHATRSTSAFESALAASLIFSVHAPSSRAYAPTMAKRAVLCFHDGAS